MRSRSVTCAVLVALALAGCRFFPGGVPASVPRRAVPSSGCAARTAVAAGTTTVNTTSGGVPRLYLQRIPVGYDGTTPIPVVFDIHGFIETAAIQQVMSEMGPIADANKFIVIYPQALGNPTVWDTRIGGPDLAYIGQVLDEVEGRLCVDQRRVFAQGLSMGAFMSSAIACQYADRFAAVAPVAGIRDPAGCAPSRPVPVVTLHGTADTWVDFAPIPGIVAAWAARNHCAPRPKETAIASDVTLVRYLCPIGDEVGFYRVAGGGHAWPGSAFSRSIAAAVGFTTFSISASPIIWDFFAHHPMPLHRRGPLGS